MFGSFVLCFGFLFGFVGWLVGWLGGWVVGWLVGELDVGWLVMERTMMARMESTGQQAGVWLDHLSCRFLIWC